jgi:hypothetical protein
VYLSERVSTAIDRKRTALATRANLVERQSGEIVGLVLYLTGACEVRVFHESLELRTRMEGSNVDNKLFRTLHGTDKLQRSKGQREVEESNYPDCMALAHFLLWGEEQKTGLQGPSTNGAPKSLRVPSCFRARLSYTKCI